MRLRRTDVLMVLQSSKSRCKLFHDRGLLQMTVTFLTYPQQTALPLGRSIVLSMISAPDRMIYSEEPVFASHERLSLPPFLA